MAVKDGAKGRAGASSAGAEDFLGIAAAARLLGVSKPTVRRWVAEGRVPARKVGRRWQIRRSDLGAVVAPSPRKPEPVAARDVNPGPVLGRLRALLVETGLTEAEAERQTAATLDEVRRALPDCSPGHCEVLVRLFLLAVCSRASDLHADHIGGEARVRLRIDGVLAEVVRMEPELLARLIAELKPWMTLDPADTQRAQDGRVTVRLLGRDIDLRVSTLPTTSGEALAVRILDRATALLPLDRLGFEADQLERFRARLHSNTGLIVVTGPAGCGTTTTVYACMDELNSDRLKVMTAEEPVQYELDGVAQSEVRPEFGTGYARTLISIMRQDPDIIFVGETRDGQVGDMVCRAGLSGHIVFTTVHANDAAGAAIRLVEMGVDPYIVASSLLCVTAQRLVRATCSDCAEPYVPEAAHLDLLGIQGADRDREFLRGRGCPRCNGTGYRGRTAIFELLDVAGPVREEIKAGETEGVRRAGRADAVGRSMAEAGAARALRGETTVEEVARVLGP